MKLKRVAQSLLLSITLATSMAVLAQVQLRITVGPPAPIDEYRSALAPGYVWAPGYWAWSHDRHVWIRGRSMLGRPGYQWEPDHWQQRGETYYRQPGYWTRNPQMQQPKAQPARPAAQKQHVQKPRNKPRHSAPKHDPWEDKKDKQRQ